MNQAETFAEAFTSLNEAQKLAVTTTEGALLVVAGPGSGKTQLLSIRIAHIIATTDVSPGNILCLTYTDAAARNMRQRLTRFVPDSLAEKVTIATYHSFGSYILQEYSQLLDRALAPTAISPFARTKLIAELFETLQFNSPLRSSFKGLPTHLSTTQKRISELKQAGKTPENLIQDLSETEEFCKNLAPLIATLIPAKNSAKTVLPLMYSLIEAIESIDATNRAAQLYKETISFKLRNAIALTDQLDKPKLDAYNDWKKLFLSSEPTHVLKFLEDLPKLNSLQHIYKLYDENLTANNLIDFDDMLLLLKRELETNTQLKLQLQERFQYILVDEFQDNNAVQNSILFSLGDNPVNEKNPNILVVGDDDQAVYKFGGANLIVFRQFLTEYPKTQVIQLTTNYRSRPQILLAAQTVLSEVEDRFDTQKLLIPGKNVENSTRVEHCVSPDTLTYKKQVIKEVQEFLDKESASKSIALIARKNIDLITLIPQLNAAGIQFYFTQTEDALSDPVVQHILNTLRYCASIHDTKKDSQEELLPQLLCHPSFSIPALDIWQLSIAARKTGWIPALYSSQKTELAMIGMFLNKLAENARTTSIEETIAVITGALEIQLDSGHKYTAPLKKWLLDDTKTNSTNAYWKTLQALQSILRFTKENEPTSLPLTLTGFVSLLDMAQKLNIKVSYTNTGKEDARVRLLTAHSAKGLEFHTILLLNATKEGWFAKGKSDTYNWPPHMPYAPEKDTGDDFRRILYVALTRAEEHVVLLSAQKDDKGKTLTPLHHISTQTKAETSDQDNEAELFPFLYSNFKDSEKVFLEEEVRKFRFSASALLDYIDLRNSGPEHFFQRHILKFPTASTTAMKFGNVIHSVFETALLDYKNSGLLRSKQDYLQLIPQLIANNKIRQEEIVTQTERAEAILETAYTSLFTEFQTTDLAEYNFGKDSLKIAGIEVSGKVDRISLTNEGLVVFDYKTSKPLTSYTNKADLQWQKLRYLVQFVFYKLALDQTELAKDAQVNNGVFVFVDSKDELGLFPTFRITPNNQDITFVTNLLIAVHLRVTSLNFPNPEELNELKVNNDFTTASTLRFIEQLTKSELPEKLS